MIDRTYLFQEGKDYYKSTEKIERLVLHHSVSTNASSVYNWWLKDDTPIGTAYIIDMEGSVYHCFDPKNWAYHTGLGKAYDTKTVGIELVNAGWLTKDEDIFKTSYGSVIDETQVYTCKKLFRGHKYYHKYTEEQLNKLNIVVSFVCNYLGIDKVFHVPKEGKTLLRDKRIKGVTTHAFINRKKSDLSPQFKNYSMGGLLEVKES